MNQYVFLHFLIEAGARTCAECKDRDCLGKKDPYCEKLQKAFRSVVGMNANKDEKK